MWGDGVTVSSEAGERLFCKGMGVGPATYLMMWPGWGGLMSQ